MPLALYVAGVAFACVAIASRYLNGRKDLPPGPPGHWLWGNEFPQSNDFLKYHEWGQLYGPIYSLRSGLRTIIVICGFEPAVQILEKEGAVTADRPRMVAGGEIRSGGMRLLLIGVGERLKKLRRALHQHLQSRAAVRYEDTQQFNARQLIRDILDEPGAIDEHTKRYAISTILSITYGQASPCDMSDPDIPLLYGLLYDLGQATRPGTWAVDQFPWLKFLPFYGRPLREQHRRELNLFRKQLQNVRTAMMVGGSGTSFGAYLLQNQKELSLSDNEIAYLAGSMFGAGSDTSAAGIRVVIMAAACFPEAQSEVQKELDTVLGHDRLPTIADLSLLPRTRAFVLETFRWRPGTAAGTQHRAMQDIHWRGYKIPAGATIIPNHWSIGRDLDFWPDGDSFVPDRWLDSTGQVVEKPAFPNFGFGRRVCPGQPVAERSMFINAAMLMQSFTISQDPSQPIDTMSFKHGVITQPAPFTAKFAVRNPGGLNTLKTMLQEL